MNVTLRHPQFPPRSRLARKASAAFSILEVMIAMAIFFMATFAILHLVSNNLQHARHLQQFHIDASSLAAELSLTNKLEEGVEQGDFGDFYPGYTWRREITQVGTNGLFQADFTLFWMRDRTPKESRMSVLLFRPESAAGSRFNR